MDKSSSSKGKGRSSPSNSSPKESRLPSDATTYVSKLQSSTTSLARSFLTTSSREAAHILSSNLADSGKSGASSSSNGVHGESSLTRQAPALNSGQGPSTDLNKSFREYYNHGSATSQHFKEFSEPKASFDAHILSHPTPNSWAREFTSSQRSSNQGRHDSPPQDHTNPVDRYNDGVEVLALLSDPHFVAISDVYDTEELSPDAVADLFSQNFSSSEQQAADRIRTALPSPPVHNPVSEPNALNLFPDFGISHHPHIGTTQDDHFASQISISQWSNVLNGYTDEVWGDLLPVVQKIKKQLEEAKDDKKHLDALAFMRLKMILGHLDGEQHLLPQAIERQGAITQSSQDLFQTHNLPQSHGIGAVTKAMNVPTLDDFLDESRSLKQLPDRPKHNSPTQRHDYLHDKHQEARLPRSTRSSESSDSGLLEFHCPWISCHERFYSMGDLRKHSESHMIYKCPHSSCDESFLARNEWMKHIRMVHHDLLSVLVTDDVATVTRE
jgi:hypothetical protein